MKNWQEIKLGDAATFINGYAFKPKDWSTEGKEIIRIQNLTGRGNDVNFFEGEIHEKYKIAKGDLLISWSATLGIFEWEREDAWLNQHIFKVVFDKIDFDKSFFKHLINNVLRKLEQRVHGSTMKHITKGNFDNTIISIPPLPEQKRIVQILDKSDALRQKNKQLLAAYDKLLQATFIEMFGDPVSNPNGWKETTIGDSCHFVKDGPHKSPNYVDQGIPFVSVNNIIKGYWDLENVKYISEEDHKLFKKRCNPKKGDVLYTKGGTTGFAKYIDIDLEFSNWVHLALLKFDKGTINGRFLESMLNTPYCYQQSQKYTRGIANRDLVLGQMKKIKHYKPPIELQNQFAQIVENIEAQKAKLKQSIQESEDLFNGLVQKAFKGEL